MELLQYQSCIQGHLFKIPTKIEKNTLSYNEKEDEIMHEDDITSKTAASIFTKQFLTFLSAVQIAISNDMHLKALLFDMHKHLHRYNYKLYL